MGQRWADCPDCGAHLKVDRLEAHRKSVHAGTARRVIARLQRYGAWALVGLLVVGAVGALALLGQETAPVLTASEEPYAGPMDAPVTVYLFGDYQCSHCRSFELTGWDRFESQWVDTGNVRVVYKDLAFLGEDSLVAAQASQAVWAQDPERWHQWKRFAYRSQGPPDSGWASRDGMIEMTRAWGQVDMDAFVAALDDETWLAEVQGDIEEARQAGVASTPTLVVGTHRLNANDRVAVDTAIQEALEEAGAA